MTNPTPQTHADPVADLSQLLDQLASTDPTPPAAGDGPDPQPVFDNVDTFIRHYLAPVVERRLAHGASAGAYWCPRWWAHPEAISRLYALWRAWETLRVSDPQLGMSTWWRDHLDPHLTALTSEYGPFGRCGPDKHVDPKPLPVQPAPAEVLAQLPDATPRRLDLPL